MADHKNQHFVPRVLLRPFTKDAEDKSINLYNIRANRLIPDAPVKGQCSRHYWYGEDGYLEAMLSKLEGWFATSRDHVVSGESSDADRDQISMFMCLQHWRTANAAARLRHSMEEMNASSWAPEEKKPVPDDKKLILTSMRIGLKTLDRDRLYIGARTQRCLGHQLAV